MSERTLECISNPVFACEKKNRGSHDAQTKPHEAPQIIPCVRPQIEGTEEAKPDREN